MPQRRNFGLGALTNHVKAKQWVLLTGTVFGLIWSNETCNHLSNLLWVFIPLGKCGECVQGNSRKELKARQTVGWSRFGFCFSKENKRNSEEIST